MKFLGEIVKRPLSTPDAIEFRIDDLLLARLKLDGPDGDRFEIIPLDNGVYSLPHIEIIVKGFVIDVFEIRIVGKLHPGHTKKIIGSFFQPTVADLLHLTAHMTYYRQVKNFKCMRVKKGLVRQEAILKCI